MSSINMARNKSKSKSVSSASSSESSESSDKDSSSSKLSKKSATEKINKLTLQVSQLISENQVLWNQSHPRNQDRSQYSSSSSINDQDRIFRLQDDLYDKNKQYNVNSMPKKMNTTYYIVDLLDWVVRR